MRIAWMVAGGLLLMGAGFAMLRTGDRPESAVARPSAQSSKTSGPAAASGNPGPAAPAPRAVAVSESDAKPDYGHELENAADRWDLAQRLFAEAQHGDAAAQFYLSLTLSECRVFDDMYFDAGNRRRTYDEALQYAVQRGGLNWEYVAPILKSCRRLMEARETPFGKWEDWMQQAAANGHPQAAVLTATSKAIKGTYATDPKEKEALLGDARRLAMRALRTKDPAAIAEMGSVTTWLLKSEGHEAGQESSWLLAACQRGLDCSRESTRYRLRCALDSTCQPYDAGMVDVIRRDAGDNFADLERRAAEINARLDADRFDEFGL